MFLFVGIDTFTKWMEASPVVNITQEPAVKFLKSIIYRFGVPKRVLTDNGTQFKGVKFLRCCADFGIHHQPSSAAHPQTNGQLERTNGLHLQGMKMRMFQDLEGKGKNWHKELPSVFVTPGFKAKPNTHSMCAQESSFHTYLTENGYKITNVSI
jgi:transposase InsO family protein